MTSVRRAIADAGHAILESVTPASVAVATGFRGLGDRVAAVTPDSVQVTSVTGSKCSVNRAVSCVTALEDAVTAPNSA